jgi:hemoglobin-like flavoprotein
MNELQVILIRRTWRLLRGIDPEKVGDTFYSKLFNDKPSLRKLFPRDMIQQYHKLIEMINTIVSQLERPGDLNKAISGMAQRDTGYGVRPAHYKLLGRSLLWTLEQGLGSDWTAEVKEAWTKCYDIISRMMIGHIARNVSI